MVKATQPIVGPLRRFIPSIGRLDTATLVFAILVSFAKILTYYFLISGNLYPLLSGLLFSVLNLVYNILWMIFWVVVIRALLSWFSQGRNPIELVMIQLTDPIVAPIRRVIPPMGGLDLSVLIFLLLLQFVINSFSGAFGPFI